MPAPQPAGRNGRQPQPPARRRPGQKAKNPVRSTDNASYGFLNQSFRPLSHFEGFQRSKKGKVEAQFFRSLTHLSKRFRLATDSFPCNMLYSFQQAREQLEKKSPRTDLIITEHKGETILATVEQIGIDHTLYYTSLNALDWLHQRKDIPSFELMLSIFAYLHQTVGMPLLTGNDFLSGCYDAIADWLENSKDEYEEVEEWKENGRLITAMRRKRPILEKAVRDPANLAAFADRIRSYQAANETQEQFQKIAAGFRQLQLQYPGHSFYRNIHSDHIEEPDEDRAWPDHYFSFFWDDNDWLYDSLMEYINGDLQERCIFEQPVAINYFHTRTAKPQSDLAFEKRLLEYCSELSSITYQLTS